MHDQTTLEIKLTTVHVSDQDRALRFYTEVLGLAKKADISRGPFRWLTVTSPAAPDGAELQLALAADDASRAYQAARRERHEPALLLSTPDLAGEHARLTARGATFTMPPTEVPGSTIAVVDDTCGNLVQLVQLHRHG